MRDHIVSLLKVNENYDSLSLGLRDIRDEMTEIGVKISVHFYLGEVYCFGLRTRRCQLKVLILVFGASVRKQIDIL